MNDTDDNNSSVCTGAKTHSGKSLLMLDWSANTQQICSSNLFHAADFRQHIAPCTILRSHVKQSLLACIKSAMSTVLLQSLPDGFIFFPQAERIHCVWNKGKMWLESLEPLN